MPSLESIASQSFERLSQAEVKLLECATLGRLADCAQKINSRVDPSEAGAWGQEQHIRARIIRWLCIDQTIKQLVDPNGICVARARIVGPLDLFAASVPFPLWFNSCSFDSDLNLRCAEIPVLNLQGTWVPSISADGIRVKHNVFLRNGFCASGQVRLLGARIGGTLDCDGSRMDNPRRLDVSSSGISLNADGAIIEGAVFLRGLTFVGEARLVGAQIGGYLDCTNSSFTNPLTNKARTAGTALNLQGARIAGQVFLRDNFRADGAVTLTGSEIGGDLDCSLANIGHSINGIALMADRASVGGSIFLAQGFRAEGEVRFLGAEVGCDLHCDGGEFTKPRIEKKIPHSISGHSAVIKGNVLLRDNFQATGAVAFTGAQIGGNLECVGGMFSGELNLQAASIRGELYVLQIQNPQLLRLDLTNAYAGAVRDDPGSWPEAKNLILDGFVYKRFADPATTDAEARLDWVSRQKIFAAQPYRQLATLLDDEGDETGSRRVLFEMERQRSLRETGAPRLWSFVRRYVIGYGYYPTWALGWLIGLIFLGTSILHAAFYASGMVPTEHRAYESFVASGIVPNDYPRFHALSYAVENSVPLLKLGQLDQWRPDPRAQALLQWFCWLQVLFGWFFATMGIAGVTGLVRRD
jgi:hypothetical protein